MSAEPHADGGDELATEQPEYVDLSMLESEQQLNPESAEASIGADHIQVDIDWSRHPGDEFSQEFEIETRHVNEFAHFESWKNGESKLTYDRYKAERVQLLFKDGEGWHYGHPQVPFAVQDKARYPQSDLDPDGHLPSQVDGVTVRQIASRSNRRDTFKKHRYKVTRGFVERVEEAFVLTWKEKHEAGREGSYTTRSNATAHKLELAD